MDGTLGKRISLFAFPMIILVEAFSMLNIGIPVLSTILKSNLTVPALWLIVALGFGLSFMAEHDIFDLVIAFGFAARGISVLLANLGTNSLGGIFFIVFIITHLVWALKLFTKGKISLAICMGAITAVELAFRFFLARLVPAEIYSVLLYSKTSLSIFYISIYITAVSKDLTES